MTVYIFHFDPLSTDFVILYYSTAYDYYRIKKKLELLEWLAALHDQELIEELADWKADRERVNIDQYNRELDEAVN